MSTADLQPGATLNLSTEGVLQPAPDAGPAAPAREPATAAPAVGDAPLTPVMRDFLRRCADGGAAPDGFCQWVEICVPAGGDEATWHAVLDAVLARHDALRAHLADARGEPVLRIPAPGAVTGADVLTRVRTSAGDDLRALAATHTAAARDRIDLRNGPLLRAVWIDAGPDVLGRLVLVAHHMVVDVVSWRVLLDDIQHAYAGATVDAEASAGSGRRQVPELPRHGQSFLGWARSLCDAAGQRRGELPHWQRTTAGTRPLLAAAVLDPARDTAATAVNHEIRLDAQTTHALLTTLPSRYRTTPDTVLLTALATAVAAWRRRGDPELLVALESHGRLPHTPDMAGPVDLSQTVGWFTATHPALVRPDPTGPAQALKSVKEQLHAGGDGLGYGILRHAPDQPLGAGTEPEIAFNYIGRFPAAPRTETAWRPPPHADPLGSGGAAGLPLPHSLMINAIALDAGDGAELGVRLTWPSALFTVADVAGLAGHLRRALAGLATDPDVHDGGLTS